MTHPAATARVVTTHPAPIGPPRRRTPRRRPRRDDAPRADRPRRDDAPRADRPRRDRDDLPRYQVSDAADADELPKYQVSDAPAVPPVASQPLPEPLPPPTAPSPPAGAAAASAASSEPAPAASVNDADADDADESAEAGSNGNEIFVNVGRRDGAKPSDYQTLLEAAGMVPTSPSTCGYDIVTPSSACAETSSIASSLS